MCPKFSPWKRVFAWKWQIFYVTRFREYFCRSSTILQEFLRRNWKEVVSEGSCIISKRKQRVTIFYIRQLQWPYCWWVQLQQQLQSSKHLGNCIKLDLKCALSQTRHADFLGGLRITPAPWKWGDYRRQVLPSTCGQITHGNWKLVVDDLFVGMTFPRDEQFAIYTPWNT